MRTTGFVKLSFLLAIAVAAQVSTGAATDEDWSRRYTRNIDRVWQAALHVLSEADYSVVKEDRKRGRIEAESHSKTKFDELVLDIRIRTKKELVVVEIQASGGGARSPADFGRLDRAVKAILHDLDLELKQ